MDGGPSFQVEVTVPAEGHAVVAPAGELDLHATPQFKEVLLQVISDGALRVVVDLGEVTFIDSTALGVLISGVMRLRGADGSLDVVCPNERIRRIFEISGLDHVFDVYGGPRKALSATR